MELNNSFSLSKLQYSKGTFQSGLVEENSLARALLLHPEVLAGVVHTIGPKFCMGYVLEGQLGNNNWQEVGQSEYNWDVFGEIIKTAYVVGTTNPLPDSRPGLGFAPFSVPLNDDYFAVGDLVRFGCGQVARVQKAPEQVGRTYVYTLELVTGDPLEYVRAGDLAIGAEVSWFSNRFEEFSEGGNSKWASPMRLTNQLSINRYSQAMTRSAMVADNNGVRLLKMNLHKGGKSSEVKAWMHEMQWQQMMHWRRNTEIDLIYGKYNKITSGSGAGTIALEGTNGRPVRSGAGLIEQIPYQNISTYASLTEDYLYDFTNHLQLASQDVENSHYVLMTGIGGKIAFDKAIKDRVRGELIAGSELYAQRINGGKALQYGKYFTTYVGVLGTTITLIHNPLMDDKRTFVRTHPRTGFPLESYNMYFFNVGQVGGQNNIQLVHKRDSKAIAWFTAGSTTPNGTSTVSGIDSRLTDASHLRSNGLDGYTTHFLTETGVFMRVPQSSGALLYAA